MNASDTSSEISLDTLHTLLLKYDSHVLDKIQELDELRFSTTPQILAQRQKSGEPFLEKTEVTTLVDWKLYV